MNTTMLALGSAQGGLGDWNPLWAMLAAYAAIVAALYAFGKGPHKSSRDDVRRIADTLERATHAPAWAAAMVGTATFGLLVAGMGFYNDVAWHVGLGRDKNLFTAPHTAIVVGLLTIAVSSLVGTYFATATAADVGFRLRGYRVPWSAVVMGLLGASALSGFPLDDLWHRAYGIDVTMWSPTHLLMILGASLSPIASLLALGEAKVGKDGDKRVGVVLIVVGMAALLGLSSAQGEFEFGVPQFQQLYHPVLVVLAAGFAFTAVAILVRRWWTPLLIGAVGFATGAGLGRGGAVHPRSAALFITSALGVSLVALVVGVERKLRFAILSGLAVSTIGLAGEWLWSRGGYQPWGTALLPMAPILAVVAAVSAALLGSAFASSVRGEALGIPRAGLAAAGLALLVALTLPLPRHGSSAEAAVHLDHVGGSVVVHAQLSPPNAADNAKWFQVLSWQGDGMKVTKMKPLGNGSYVSEGPVPATGRWKTMLRLHRGAEMGAVPIFLPADLAIGAPEVPAVSRTARFVNERRYLLREQHAGSPLFADGIFVLLALVAIAWATSFVYVAGRVRRGWTTVTKARELARV